MSKVHDIPFLKNDVKYTICRVTGMKMRAMKVYCPDCGDNAIIRKHTVKIKNCLIYYACSDVECGHTFVLNVTFSHTISPSAKTGSRLVRSLLSLLRSDEGQIALDLLQGQAI